MATSEPDSTLVPEEDHLRFWARCLQLAQHLYPKLEKIRSFIEAEERKPERHRRAQAKYPEFEIDPQFKSLSRRTVADLQELFCDGLPGGGISEQFRLVRGFCTVADRVCYGRKLGEDSYLIWHLLACSEALGVPVPTPEQLLDAAMEAGLERAHTPDELDTKGKDCPYDTALEKWGKRLTRNLKTYRAYSLDDEQRTRLPDLDAETRAALTESQIDIRWRSKMKKGVTTPSDSDD